MKLWDKKGFWLALVLGAVWTLFHNLGCSQMRTLQNAVKPEVKTAMVEKARQVVDRIVEDKLSLPSRFVVHTVYFDFDKSTVKPQFLSTLDTTVRLLQKNPQDIVIEGNCDERGPREYNKALGLRRAEAVSQVLSQSCDVSQASLVSHGEDKPISDGHNEDAWRLNRRVDIKLLVR